jgi:hypothetical protein
LVQSDALRDVDDVGDGIELDIIIARNEDGKFAALAVDGLKPRLDFRLGQGLRIESDGAIGMDEDDDILGTLDRGGLLIPVEPGFRDPGCRG